MYISLLLAGILGTIFVEILIVVGIMTFAFFKEFSKNQREEKENNNNK